MHIKKMTTHCQNTYENITLTHFIFQRKHQNTLNIVQKSLQWGAADAEIKVPSDSTELKRSPFKAWSRSVYGHTC